MIGRNALVWTAWISIVACAGMGAAAGVATVARAADQGFVNESARQIPVAAEVDVVVVGGSTGAVAAAAEAAHAGAKVFLAAPHPYLGDDMTATLRLWLEPGEVPASSLAQRIYRDAGQKLGGPDPNRLPFSYTADRAASPKHKDSVPPGKLADSLWGNAASQSVQYDGDVTLVADLQKTQEVAEVRLMAYQRDHSDPATAFKVARVAVSVSDDQKTWHQLPVVENKAVGVTDEVVTLSAPVARRARYVKLAVGKAAEAGRMLLGEIEIVGPARVADKTSQEAPPPRPLHVKKVLDDALLEAGVQFLYSCYATDLLQDDEGRPCGIVMANRAGRQAVVAKTIIDATPRATVARLARARFRPLPPGPRTVKFVVIGGEPRSGEGLSSRIAAPAYRGAFPNQAKTTSGLFPVIEYTLRTPMADDSAASWAAADQRIRTLTYHPEQQFTSDVLFEVPRDCVVGDQTARGNWAGPAAIPLAALRPAGIPRVYVLGGCADVPRAMAEKLLRPVALVELAERVGKAAAEEAKSLSQNYQEKGPRPGNPVAPQGSGTGSKTVAAPRNARVRGKPAAAPAAAGEVREMLSGVRPTQRGATIAQDHRALPVLGSYDVVVIGGGTAGAPAGIAAARQGAKTLVAEYLSGLGGVGTLGAISKYYWGNRVGFSATVAGDASWVIEQKAEWYRSELLKAGADVWFGAVGCGALVEKGYVRGVVLATPQGRGVVLAKVVIDATGNADVAAPAGAECVYTDHTEFAMQGTGLPPRNLGASYANTDFTITDETDLVDIWHLFVYAKEKYPEAFDQGKLIDTRERRRIVGDFTITILDEINRRTYPDTVFVAYSNFDTHGYTVDPYLMLEHPDKQGVYVQVPYRCMLPKGLEGILVGGLGLSVHRDALPLVRMQADLQNQGYALGVAAAMAVRSGTLTRNIDLRALQKHLVELGNLPESVLTAEDSYPIPAARVAEAVREIPKNLAEDHQESVARAKNPKPTDGSDTGSKSFKAAAVILAQPDQALPLVRSAYESATGEARLAYAKLLGMMGDRTGADDLLEAVAKADGWDSGWRFRGGGQFGEALSPLDKTIIALGRSGERRAVPVIAAKMKLLTAASEFSHHRAVALALELLRDPAAARPLADLLAQPGMAGYAHVNLEAARQRDVPHGTAAVQSRDESLRELVLARALLRCGDQEGIGRKTLEAYAQDLRGHLARHARAVLDMHKE